jgi:hypothetical protein
MQIRNYQNALSYLERRADVDADRLGAWGSPTPAATSWSPRRTLG